ncbi:hypothetical protein KIL84_010251 [Mauremys mutica]|uniref:Ubiquitin-like protein NEDD8 n=6 Tax=Durocryptodira TaxID=1579337 RepID=A0A9D3XM53_9SAUR|nr:hypothetical protein KIL84_010251 [Mauremys mutica]
MLIKVKTLTGKEIEIDIEPTDKVERIKERVEEKEGIPPQQQRLIYSGKQMNDEKTAADYKIQGGSVLHLVLALRGGQLRGAMCRLPGLVVFDLGELGARGGQGSVGPGRGIEPGPLELSARAKSWDRPPLPQVCGSHLPPGSG